MSHRILITGSSGLVGSAVAQKLTACGVQVVPFDLQANGEAYGDTRDRERLQNAMERVDGIIHFAAVSRVVWGERDPEQCWATNVGGIKNILDINKAWSSSAWVIFASSREVYGQPDTLPATEDSPLRPVNVYGRSKVEGERLIAEARREGMNVCTIRLSNVFGTPTDHADRVVPAFARAAAHGRELRVDGTEQTFDFTHIDDVSRGIVALVDRFAAGKPAPPPIHFVSGVPTTLGQLARLAVQIGQSGATIRQAAPRDFDVGKFFGDPSRARELLGWQPQVRLEEGLARLIHAFRERQNVTTLSEVVG